MVRDFGCLLGFAFGEAALPRISSVRYNLDNPRFV